MTITELKQMIEVAEQLGHGDATINLCEGRDGQASYPMASAVFITEGDQREKNVMLVFGYK